MKKNKHIIYNFIDLLKGYKNVKNMKIVAVHLDGQILRDILGFSV